MCLCFRFAPPLRCVLFCPTLPTRTPDLAILPSEYESGPERSQVAYPPSSLSATEKGHERSRSCRPEVSLRDQSRFGSVRRSLARARRPTGSGGSPATGRAQVASGGAQVQVAFQSSLGDGDREESSCRLFCQSASRAQVAFRVRPNSESPHGASCRGQTERPNRNRRRRTLTVPLLGAAR